MTVLEIKTMRLRVAGRSPQQAEDIGRQVAQALADQVGRVSTSRPLGKLDLKIQAPAGQSPEALSAKIVQAILDRIEG